MIIKNNTNIKIDNKLLASLAAGKDTEFLIVHVKYPDNEDERSDCGRFNIANPLPEIVIFLRTDFPITQSLSNGQEITIKNTNQYIAAVFLCAFYHYTAYQKDNIFYQFHGEKKQRKKKNKQKHMRAKC